MTEDQAVFPKFLARIPDDLQAEIDRATMAGSVRLQFRDWEGAFAAFQELNDEMVRRQPPGKRYHKGTPLHNMGLARLLAGDVVDGFRYTLLAFAEDSLSAGDERLPEDEERKRPAFQNLVAMVAPQIDWIVQLGRHLREMGANQLWQLPDRAIDAAALAGYGVPEPVAQPERVTKRRVGRFGSDWHDRVFVGGPYHLIAVMNAIKGIVRQCGYDAVMASDFDISKELNHHHALLLLHECRLAIFEVSMEAGQLMELERTRDYEIDPRDILVLYQAADGWTAKTSGMLDALLSRMALAPTTYEDTSQLPAIVTTFLASRGGRHPAGSTVA